MSARSAAAAAGGVPHLLYVAWGYPPSRGAGMYRALATANAFAQAGWQVTVLTAQRETFERLTGVDLQAEAAIDPRIRVERVDFDLTRGEPDLARWSRLRRFSPLLWSFVRTRAERRPFPESNYGSWAPALRAAALRIHAERPVSLVIGTANPNVDFVPGDVLARHGVPYVMDYRDTWHLDVYSGRRVGSPRSRSARLERRLLGGAREAWFVNEPIRDWHAGQYPRNRGAFHVVANGYDERYTGRQLDRDPDPAAGLTFGYLGTVYGPMPLRESLEAWRLARTRSDLLARSHLVFAGRLGHYATPDPAALRLLEEFAGDGVRYTGPVSKSEVAQVYADFDALVLILGRSRYVTSGKVFEYASTGLPVVSLHAPETASTAVLRDYPGWFPAAEVDPRAMADALVAAADRAARYTGDDRRRAREWAARYERGAQLRPRIAALTEAVSP